MRVMRLEKLSMRKSSPLIFSAWLVHAAYWFLPAVRISMIDRLPGWGAFLVVSRMLWSPMDSYDHWYNAVLALLSVVATVLFVVGSPWVVFRGSRLVLRTSAWSAAVAFVINAHWVVLGGSDRWDLRIGYFLWWLSFALLAAGLFVSATEPAQRQTPLLASLADEAAMPPKSV